MEVSGENGIMVDASYFYCMLSGNDLITGVSNLLGGWTRSHQIFSSSGLKLG